MSWRVPQLGAVFLHHISFLHPRSWVQGYPCISPQVHRPRSEHDQGCIQTMQAISSCSQAYAFSITAASKVSCSKPCTNVPTRCTLCPEVHWKYNIPNHLTNRHPLWQSQVNATTRQAWEISNEEKQRIVGLTETATNAESSTQPGVLCSSQVNENNKRPPSSPPGTPHTKSKQRHRKVQKTVRFSSTHDENINPFVN